MWFKKKPKKRKSKAYTLSIVDVAAVGDRYNYTISAASAEEAFEQLVRFFYGTNHVEVKQEHFDTRIPSSDYFRAYGMPYWFARCISNNDTPEDRAHLAEYMITHNIESKNQQP